jgi:glycosyltransferase involved in cell wall biosynthesis
MSPPDTLIVVPARNEAQSIVPLIREIRQAAPTLPILVLDDGSTDDTGPLAQAAGASVLSFAYHLGLGGCVQAAYQYAFSEGFQYVIRLDGDGQHDPRDIPRMAVALQTSGCELVIASRYLNHSATRQITPRTVGTKVFQFILRILLDQEVTDPTSGYVGVNRRALELFSRSFPLEYPEIEALVVLQRRAFRFKEIPTTMRAREHGRSTLTPARVVFYMIHVLLGVFVNIVRIPSPMALFRRSKQ